MDRNCLVFAIDCWEMLFKIIGQLLGTTKKVRESRKKIKVSRWEMPKGYRSWMACGQI
jgi:hypothetical protein